ncbi:MAG: cytochrome P460 family protein [Rhodospirillaceae bacterium]|nr:cytochrome P460 family protein [Rhodospirillaceae bacterium]
MRKLFGVCGLGLIVAMAIVVNSSGNVSAQEFTYTPQFNSKNELMLPRNHIWREWVYSGAIVTPNSLKDGAAPFPEFHSVWGEPGAYAYYKKTGKFPEGTGIAKELGLVGSTEAVSGNGFFMGKLQGFEITIKSKKLYPNEPGNWAYYTFGHHAEPYNKSAKKMPAEACNACHESTAADDFVFTQYYPFLAAAKPK